jgi:hypothetical protein
MTERQRAHSKLYMGYHLGRGGMGTISDVIARSPLDRVVETVVEVGFLLRMERQKPEEYFAQLTSSSDAVVRGVVTGKVSQVTEEDYFVFTDYDVIVEEVIKNNSATPLQPGVAIIVTRPGGKVLRNGVVIKAHDLAYEPLPVKSDEVVLFLNAVPETGAYRTIYSGASGAFELTGNSVRPLTQELLPDGVMQDTDRFLGTLRAFSHN